MFYDRHVKALLGYFSRRTFSAEEAADLTAETFASALAARRRFKPGKAPATAWLFSDRRAPARRLPAPRLRRAADAALARDGAPAGERGGRRDDPHAGRRRRALRAVRAAAARSGGSWPRTSSTSARTGSWPASSHTSEAAIRQRMSRGLATLRRGLRAMSDYITALRQDLVEAAERQQQRSPARPRVAAAAAALLVTDCRARRRCGARRAAPPRDHAARGLAAAPARGAEGRRLVPHRRPAERRGRGGRARRGRLTRMAGVLLVKPDGVRRLMPATPGARPFRSRRTERAVGGQRPRRCRAGAQSC